MEQINEKKCASCWPFSRIRNTMHGSENVKYDAQTLHTRLRETS